MIEIKPPSTVKMQKHLPFEFGNDAISCKEAQIEHDTVSTAGIVVQESEETERKSYQKFMRAITDRCQWKKLSFARMPLVLAIIGLLAWNIKIQVSLKKISDVQCNIIRHEDCQSRMLSSCHKDGVYTIYSTLSKPLSVYCDQITDGGGWTIIQRRVNGKVNFYRNWSDYRTGFGDLNGNMWLGNEAIHKLTQNPSELRIDLEDHDGKRAYAKYSMFKVGDEKSGYKLHVSGYTGTTGESSLSGFISVHNGMSFTTYDKDNDNWKGGNCGVLRKGGWWYNSCAKVHLNGIYSKSKVYGGGTGNYWYDWKKLTALKFSEMKVRKKIVII